MAIRSDFGNEINGDLRNGLNQNFAEIERELNNLFTIINSKVPFDVATKRDLANSLQGIRNIAYQIEKGTDDGNSNAENVVARTNINGKTYNSLGSRLDSIERAMLSAGIKLEEYNA
ncbi:hypothetical protein [Leuconostoc mesenteroides]|uniref:hypothetical protein n=1 Tax=Leuconostoc mesenteroides TaxID=1245 RepID=UPI00236115E3|nr:hypothetical protein [Leuconostoc mesenteroides]